MIVEYQEHVYDANLKESIYARTGVEKQRYYARALESVHHYLIRVLHGEQRAKIKIIFYS